MSYLYFIQEADRGCVKIGITTDPLMRLAQLQNGNPDFLTIEGLATGSGVAEYALHVRFSESRVRGEWFQPTDEVLEFMDSLPCYDEVAAGEALPDLDCELRAEAMGFKLAGITRPRGRKR